MSAFKATSSRKEKSTTPFWQGPPRSKPLDRLVYEEPRPMILSKQSYLDSDVDRQCESRLKRHRLGPGVCRNILIVKPRANSITGD
jgi:hypothetical protein